VPLVALLPLQDPEALQESALADDQLSVPLPPFATTPGVAVKVALGMRLTVTLELMLIPPGPLQTSE
jgi:hypothetical protein